MGYERICVRPMEGALGAEIADVDLTKPIDSASFREIHRAFLEHHVLCFREQHITPAEQLAFGGMFGEIDTYPFLEPLEGFPGVIPIIKEPETRLNFGGGWHTDGSYMPEPPMATLLHALDVPRHGGDTLFANMYAAYEALSDGMKQLLDGLQAVFTPAGVHGDHGAYTRMKAGDAKRREDPELAESRCVHPVVRTHPETGRKALYVGRFHVERLCDMTVEESRPLLDLLAEHAVQPSFQMRLRWHVGSLVLWDNRCVQHYALNDYPSERREMNRITIKGNAPF